MQRSILSSLVVGALLLAACGSDSDADSDEFDGSEIELDGLTFIADAVEGEELVAGSEIQITFTGDTVSVNAGCNTANGGYTLDGATLEVDAMAMTQMACDQALMDQDQWVVELLQSGPTLAIDGVVLTIEGSDGTIMSMTERSVADPDRPIEGTRWVVTGTVATEAISSVPIGAEASLTITDGTAAVEAGCNTGSAEVEITDTTLTFSPMALTRMMCADEQMALEAAVTAALDGEVSYEINADTLSLRRDAADGSGEIGLELTAEQ